MLINEPEITFLDVIDSTNNYAQHLISQKKAKNGQIILAQQQTSGKGQRNNTWQSSKGENLLMSLILFPNHLPIQHQFYLNMAVALSIVECLNKIVQFHIKWPNDIYYNQQKLGGILIENSITNNQLKTSIIGIGINVNQTQFPTNIPNPISLKLISANHYQLSSLAKSIASKILQYLNQIEKGHFLTIRNEYKSHLFAHNQWQKFKTNQLSFNGKICDVNPMGHLVVEHQNGLIKTYANGEIEFIF